MSDSGNELFRLGFLTAIEIPERGYVGGLLVTNHFGRPLEFQCTAPLKPNRTQEILYGPTLIPYVLGDLIGRTLIEKVGVKPHLVLTERHELLALRELVEIPVACVDDLPVIANGQAAAPRAADLSPSGEPSEASSASALVPSEEPVVVESPSLQTRPLIDATSGECPRERTDDLTISLGRQTLRFHAAHADDRSIASRGARVVPNNADLREPFERVREALGETARLGGAR
jgi:hypothetical protein